ncbi:MAG: glutathione S-transferase domain-containing protein [Deltaproteobacteria bacterium]|nr:glutathione S-transferase domain-containing protein [Deltaproteobacteria bacterium]
MERTGRTQVPCLFVDGEPMFESLDIVDWFERSFERQAVS